MSANVIIDTIDDLSLAPVVEQGLSRKAANAALWSVLEYGSATGLRVVSSLALTRLLAPSYFGEMTLVTTIIVGLNLLSDIGLAPSVIQSPRGDDELFLNTAWTLQAIRGLSLFLFACLLSVPAAAFYRDTTLSRLLPVLAISILLAGFNSTNLLTLSRHMEVRRLFAIDFSSSVMALAFTLAWAWKWPTVWAIAYGQLFGAVYKLLISHIRSITPGFRNRFHWDPEAVHSIVHFGKWILLGTAFFFFGSQADRLVLGRLVSLHTLGIYTLAYSLSDIPRQVFLALGSRVAYPFIAKSIRGPRDEFRSNYFRYRRYLLLAGACLLAAMVTWGHLLITRLYDARYHEGAWIIPVLALGLWHTLLYQTTAPVLFSLGKPQFNAWGNLGYSLMMLIGIPLAFHFFGLFGAVIAIAAGDFPLYVILGIGSARQGVSTFRQDAGLTAVFLALLACGYVLQHGSRLFHLGCIFFGHFL